MNKMTRTLTSFGIAVATILVSLATIAWAIAAPKAPAGPEPQAQEEVVPEETAEQQASEAPAEEAPAPEEAEAEQPEADEHETFVATWAERIDNFNAGYPLEGYGRAFAEAAYTYGVDPRYSPAIARVESGSGLNCYYDHNAWGWGSYSWPDWESAIDGHVSAMASNYGHTLDYGAASVYNESDPDGWYSEVASSMSQIWESESL